ncbi:inovirus Gp2 family protein [Shewanella profunda]|uniref:YagK/YfjJ domain-containing protein n=1 Tax=Shewanella profunda TaxID=254793 RepID=UPI00200F9CB0|nr:inovirus-type Gp2 protein [Shewanella profunda]MCL1091532.1 inovirus Gp2 family protein [Shewanella profunda]
MKYVSYQEYIEHGGEVYRVQAKPSGIHTKPFKTFLDELAWMVSRHSRVFLYRFDLRFADDKSATKDSFLMSIFFRRLRRQLERHYKTKDVGYSWAREIEKAKQQHYHCVLMMDGNRIHHPRALSIKIKKIWLEISGGSPYWSRWHFFHRLDFKKQHKAIYHSSYLFKVRGKGYKPKQARDYGHSRLC